MGIGGDSGSGKSTLLAQLKSLIPSNSLLELEGDGDHKWERGDKRWQRFTHLDPKANHLHRQSDHILRLKAAKSILRIEYDHSTGHFTQPQVLEAKDYVVICGLHPFYLPKMRRSIDLKIFLETDESLRQHWKVKRDTSNRGYTAEKVIEQLETRMDDSRKYIQPQKEYADLILNYFATVDPTTVPLGDPVPIRLRMTLDSSLQLDGLLDLALHYGFEIEHDYSLDLKTQFLLVSCSEIIAPVQDIAQDLIENLEEIMPLGGNWHTDYRGLVQLIIMMLVSQKRKDWYESGN